jgi:hypothetical protein
VSFLFLEVYILKYRIKRRYKVGLLRKCWNCGHTSVIWKITCDNCKTDKMQKYDDNNNDVLDYKKKTNAYYVANCIVRSMF